MTEASSPRKSGARRSAESRAAILDATRAELSEAGWRKFSVDSVARRAKASKQTIYRWWPAIGTMCVEAGLSLLPEARQTGRDPAERVRDLIAPIEQTAMTGSGHAVLRGALLASCDEAEAGEMWRSWQRENVRAPLRLILAELANRGVIRRDFDVDRAVDSLLGPFWNRLLLMRAPIEDGYSEELAAGLLKRLQN